VEFNGKLLKLKLSPCGLHHGRVIQTALCIPIQQKEFVSKRNAPIYGTLRVYLKVDNIFTFKGPVNTWQYLHVQKSPVDGQNYWLMRMLCRSRRLVTADKIVNNGTDERENLWWMPGTRGWPKETCPTNNQ